MTQDKEWHSHAKQNREILVLTVEIKLLKERFNNHNGGGKAKSGQETRNRHGRKLNLNWTKLKSSK